MYEVQSGVPIPPVDRRAKQPRRKHPVEGMKVDDFYLLPGRKTNSVIAYVSRITKDLEGRWQARKKWMRKNESGKWRLCEQDAPGAVEGVGVWRVE